MNRAFSLSGIRPACEPPTPIIEIRTPVLPSGRVGMPVAEALLVCAMTFSPSAVQASALAVSCRKVRRESKSLDIGGFYTGRSPIGMQMAAFVHRHWQIGQPSLARAGAVSSVQPGLRDFENY